MQEAAEGAHFTRQRGCHLRPLFPAVEETQGLKEVLIVVAFVGLVAGEREHPVGCGGEQQGTGGVPVASRVVEQFAREHRRVAVAMQQIPKPLELVHDDEVGLQRIHAGVGQLGAEPGDQAVAGLCHFCGIGVPAAREEFANPFEFLEEVAIRLHVAAETLDDALVDAFEGEVVHRAVPTLDAGRDLQQVVQAARARNEVAQEMEQQGAFLRHTRRGAQIEGCARRQADEVHPVGVEARLVAQLQGNERHAGRQGQLAPPEDVQPVEVLGGDRLVRADVEDVDPLGAVPQVFDHAGDDPARHHRLAEADFVGDQELADRIVLAVEPIEDVVDGAPLKDLEGSERRVGAKPFIRHAQHPA